MSLPERSRCHLSKGVEFRQVHARQRAWLGPKFRGLLASHSRSMSDLGGQECRICGKEEQGPSPEGKSSEWMLKELSLYSLGLGQSASDLNGGVTVRCVLYFGAMPGDDVEE